MKRRVGEEGFRVYASLPTHERTYAEVAKRLGVCRGTIARAARRDGWGARLDAIEKKAREKSDEDLAAKIAEINSRHVRVARFLMGKGIESLQSLKIDEPRDAAEIIEVGLRLERELTGVANEESVFEIT